MYEYMVSRGADPERLLLEDESSTTIANIDNAKKILPEGASVAVITNDYHLARRAPVCWRMPVWGTRASPRKRRIRGSGWR